MAIPAINQLANMEFQLYPGRVGMNAACPSFINGYVGNSLYNYGINYGNYYNPAFRGYNYDTFTHQNDATNVNSIYTSPSYSNYPSESYGAPSDNSVNFRSLSNDLNTIGDYYVKNSVPSESLAGAAIGGAAFGVLNNPRTVAHWWNTLGTTFKGDVNTMFADVKVDGTNLNKLYNGTLVHNGKEFKGGYEIVSEAYARMHKLECLTKSKLGIFRKSLSKQPELMKEYEVIKKGLTESLKTGNPETIAMWTERAKRLGNRYTGYIPNGLRAIGMQKPMTALRKYINPSQYEPMEGVIKKNLTEAGSKTTFGQFMKHSCGIKSGLFFAGMEFLNDAVFEHKIQDAFEKDTETGMTQLRQTAIKGVGSAAGWAIGEGIGAWAGAKIGAALGTAVAPGVGTAIGAIAGLVGGSIGCWLAGKITHKINGPEAGTLAKVEKMKQTKQGQHELLSITAQQAEDDKKLSPQTLQALKNVANFYGAGNE